MRSQAVILIVLLFLLVSMVPFICKAEIAVGVKKGDWIEYNVTVTGNVPQGHNITWARMEVTDVQGKSIDLSITTNFTNETLLPEKITLNLETGVLGDDFIIPANLNHHDSFFEVYSGNIVISDIGIKNVSGVDRTVVFGNTAQTTYVWDKTTGVLIEATTSSTGYSMTTVAERTNMWTPNLFGLNLWFFFILIAVALVALLVVVATLYMSRRKINLTNKRKEKIQ
jgi:hypothetical protein